MLAFSISFLIMTFDMPAGPSKFPRIILFFLLLFSGYILVTGIRKTLLKKDVERKFLNYKHPLVTFFMIAIYVFLIDILGFFSSTSIFIAIFMLFYNVRKYRVVFLCVLGVNLFVYYLFVWQLNIQLPAGLLF
jgi:phosphatidylglycerophosphate synthase